MNGDDEEEFSVAEHSKLVLEAMRHHADQQMLRAERVRSTARQMFVYVSVLFTVAQTVAFTSFGAEVSDQAQRFILGSGLVAAVALGFTGIMALLTDQLRSVSDASPDDIARESDKAIDAGEFVGDALVKLYSDTSKARVEAIEEKRQLLRFTTRGAIATVVLVLAEIAISLVARMP